MRTPDIDRLLILKICDSGVVIFLSVPMPTSMIFGFTSSKPELLAV